MDLDGLVEVSERMPASDVMMWGRALGGLVAIVLLLVRGHMMRSIIQEVPRHAVVVARFGPPRGAVSRRRAVRAERRRARRRPDPGYRTHH